MNGDNPMSGDSDEYPCPPTPPASKTSMPTNYGPTGKAAHPRAVGHKTGRAAEHSAPAHKPPPKKGY